MDELKCYEPTSLIANLHKNVPFLTNSGSRERTTELILNLDEIKEEYYDNFEVSIATVITSYRSSCMAYYDIVSFQTWIRNYNSYNNYCHRLNWLKLQACSYNCMDSLASKLQHHC